MSAGAWVNNDSLVLQFGTAKAAKIDSGDYLSYGANRLIEARIDLSQLVTANPTIVDLNTIIPSMANFYIEKVELTAEVGMSTASSPTLSIGVVNANLTGGASTVVLGTTGVQGYTPNITTA